MASLQDWIAFEELHRPLFREHGAMYFSNSNKPSRDFNYAFCEVSRPLLRSSFTTYDILWAVTASFLDDHPHV